MRSNTIREQLTSEFFDLLDENVVLEKEVYAHIGLTFYHFALVEHSLINIVTFNYAGEKAFQSPPKNQQHWAELIDEGERLAISKTFGNLVKSLSDIQEFQTISLEVSNLKKLRDYFAHHFMREEAALIASDEGRWFALEKMFEVRKQARAVEEALKPPFDLMCRRHGIGTPSDEELAVLTNEYLAESAQALEMGKAKMGWEND